MNKTRWLCYGDVGIDCYPGEVFLGGISLNHLVHLHHLGESELSFYGPLSNHPLGLKLTEKLHSLGVTIIEKESSTFNCPPPQQNISHTEKGEKSFDTYQGDIFNLFTYRRPESSFDKILIPAFDQNFSMVDQFFEDPCPGQVVVDILDGKDFDYDLEKLRLWEGQIDTLVVGCGEDHEGFFMMLKSSIKSFKWKLLVTRGALAGFYWDGIQLWDFTPDVLNRIVDSTGAGDAFLSSFLHHKIGSSSSMESLFFASGYAANILTRKGPH